MAFYLFNDLIGYEDIDQSSYRPDIQAEKEEVKDILGNAHKSTSALKKNWS